MNKESLMIACLNDLAGKTRGKAFPSSNLEKRLHKGIGWVPTNALITCFDKIAESPYGSLGDLVLIPDENTIVYLETCSDKSNEQFVLGDVFHTDGRPWECCTRYILKSALERLHKVTGLNLFSAFEHEFQFTNDDTILGSAFSYSGFRIKRDYCESLIGNIRAAGFTPDTIMKEFGDDQYEVTIAPSKGVRSGDEAVILRELMHLTAEQLGDNITLSPITSEAGVGNGVHIHMSFVDDDGKFRTYDESSKYGLSEVSEHFIAGVLNYLDRIIALTAPSVISYKRLTPHKWSAAFNNLGYRDREAAIRICPVSQLSKEKTESQFNFEFRAADAAASPYLTLAAIIHAGAQGIEDKLPCPEATEEDLSRLSNEQLKAKNLNRLPTSLPEALEKFINDKTVTSWFPENFAQAYYQNKLGEIDFLNAKTENEIYDLYKTVY